MINYKTGYSKKEKSEISGLLMDLTDVYSDFYVTKNNLRLFIKDNPDILFDSLKQGDYISYDNKGMALVVGFSDGAKRKYLKVLTEKPEDVEKYLKVILWNTKIDLYCKIKKNNPVKGILLKNGFQFFGGRGIEVLLKRVYKNNQRGQ